MMLSWTSDVPPSIELAFERSHSRVRRNLVLGEAFALPAQRLEALGRQQHFVAALVQFGARSI